VILILPSGTVGALWGNRYIRDVQTPVLTIGHAVDRQLIADLLIIDAGAYVLGVDGAWRRRCRDRADVGISR
jgi:hypothetical protein